MSTCLRYRWRTGPALERRTCPDQPNPMKEDSMATGQLPDAEILRKILSYDPDSGSLYWRHRPPTMFADGIRLSSAQKSKSWNAKNEGREAFTSKNGDGYRNGAIFGKNYKAHRVIWKLVTGFDAEMIDHINGDRADNRFCNLRSATRVDNCRNASLYRTNTSGSVGIDFLKSIPGQRRGRWRARICVNGKLVALGLFSTREDAVRARKAAERKYGFHPNHGRKK